MAIHNNVCQKAEAAIVALLKTKDLGSIPVANVFAGMSLGVNEDPTAEQDTNPLPRVTVHADGGEESIPNTGNFGVQITVNVESNADDDNGLHTEDAGAVFDHIVTDSFAEDIATADFTCLGVVFGSLSSGRDGRKWRSTLSLTAHCCGSSLT